MDGRANTDALNAALRGCSKTHRQEAAGGGRQWLGGDVGGGGGLAGAGWVAGRGRAAWWTSSSVVHVPVIMQRQFPAILCPRFSSSTVAGYSCSETGTHSANCELIVEFPQVPFLDQSLTCPLLCNVVHNSCSRSSTSPSWRRCRLLWSLYSEKHRDSSVAVH